MPTHRSIIALLALLTATTFHFVLFCDFVNFDDPVTVTANPFVRGGLRGDNIAWAWSNLHAGYWIPLTWLSLQADATLFELAPRGFHFTSLLLHVINTVLLYLLMLRFGGSWRVSALAAVLFAIHPLRVESVAWISERKDVLSAMFGLLALLAYVHFVRRRTACRYALVLLCYAASLMSKPTLVTLPVLLLLLDYWPLRQISSPDDAGAGTSTPTPWRALIIEKIPLFLFAFIAGALALLGQHQADALGTLAAHPPLARLENAVVAYARYLYKMVWFANLAVFYPHPPKGWPLGTVTASLTMLAAISALAVHQRRTRPWLLVGWLWYLVALLPMIGLIQIGAFSLANRFTYLPAIGVTVMLVFSLPRRFVDSRIATATAFAVVIVMVIFTYIQTLHWRNSETLFRHTLAVTQHNWVAHNNLAIHLNETGRTDEAIAHLHRALALQPDYADAHTNLGIAHALRGEWDPAVVHFSRAVTLAPEHRGHRLNLERALRMRESP